MPASGLANATPVLLTDRSTPQAAAAQVAGKNGLSIATFDAYFAGCSSNSVPSPTCAASSTAVLDTSVSWNNTDGSAGGQYYSAQTPAATANPSGKGTAGWWPATGMGSAQGLVAGAGVVSGAFAGGPATNPAVFTFTQPVSQVALYFSKSTDAAARPYGSVQIGVGTNVRPAGTNATPFTTAGCQQVPGYASASSAWSVGMALNRYATDLNDSGTGDAYLLTSSQVASDTPPGATVSVMTVTLTYSGPNDEVPFVVLSAPGPIITHVFLGSSTFSGYGVQVMTADSKPAPASGNTGTLAGPPMPYTIPLLAPASLDVPVAMIVIIVLGVLLLLFVGLFAGYCDKARKCAPVGGAASTTGGLYAAAFGSGRSRYGPL
jgi:hypothetical protein